MFWAIFFLLILEPVAFSKGSRDPWFTHWNGFPITRAPEARIRPLLEHIPEDAESRNWVVADSIKNSPHPASDVPSYKYNASSGKLNGASRVAVGISVRIKGMLSKRGMLFLKVQEDGQENFFWLASGNLSPAESP